MDFLFDLPYGGSAETYPSLNRHHWILILATPFANSGMDAWLSLCIIHKVKIVFSSSSMRLAAVCSSASPQGPQSAARLAMAADGLWKFDQLIMEISTNSILLHSNSCVTRYQLALGLMYLVTGHTQCFIIDNETNNCSLLSNLAQNLPLAYEADSLIGRWDMIATK